MKKPSVMPICVLNLLDFLIENFAMNQKKKKRKFGNESLEEICVSEARSSLFKIK